MKKTLLTALLFLSVTIVTRAQSKVFSLVSEEVSSQMKAIIQDGSLVGYLMFTQLEKASADSMNYRLSIMDENLNDIGTVNFREQRLSLQAVSFEQDVLCLAYLKSNTIGIDYSYRKDFNKAAANSKSAIFTQFVNLHGTILRTNTVKADIAITSSLVGWVALGSLKQSIQLKNIPQRGFACFYGDDSKRNLLVYNTAGNLIWQKPVTENAEAFSLMTSGDDAYILMKKKEKMINGGYELIGFNTRDSTTIPKYVLKDKKGNSLRVLQFDNDPVTGKPYLSGQIISKWGNSLGSANREKHGPYSGVFSILLTGHRKTDIHESYSYWDDGSKAPSISKRGRFQDPGAYARIERSFRDYQGNTYFAGSYLERKPKWVSIGISVAFSWTLIIPAYNALLCGCEKARLTNGALLKLDAKGVLTQESSIPATRTPYNRGMAPIAYYDKRNYYVVSNSDSKTNYEILDDNKNITIYNITQKKVIRTIPHKDKGILTSVYPAKEGYIMVNEYNKKEKTFRLSIEAL